MQSSFVLNLDHMLQTAYGPSCMNRSSVFQWHKRLKEGRESVRDDEKCGRSREVRTSEMIGQINDFMNWDRRVSIETLSAQFNVSVGAVHTIFFFFFFFSCIFILLSRESDQCAIRARFGVAGHLSTTPRWGNPAKCLSQRHNKQTCRLVLHTVPLMPSVKQGSCEYQF